MIRNLLPAAVAVLGIAAFGVPSAASTSPPHPGVTTLPARTLPNVVLFLVDDATAEDIEYMPAVQELLVDQGATFQRSYTPFPVCCPSRASILSGLYPHNHRVLSNIRPFGGFAAFDDTETIATWLTDDYTTGHVGKYFNDYMDKQYVPPGWDDWRATVPPTTYDYLDTKLNINGELKKFTDVYASNIYGRESRRFVANAASPFFLHASYVAPHNSVLVEPDDPATLKSPYPAPKYRDTYLGPSKPNDPSFNEEDVRDKPRFLRKLPPLTEEQIAGIGEVIAQRRESLQSVDDQIAATIQAVADRGELGNTYFIFVSDNGYMNGQHRIAQGKWVPYEPSARIPLIIRGPGIAPASQFAGLSGHQDIAPTILDMTNHVDRPSFQLDGRSLLPLLAGTKSTGRVQLIERVRIDRYSDVAIDSGNITSEVEKITWVTRGMVTADGWKYLEYPVTDEIEMYDLNTDPYEEHNLAKEPAFADRQRQLAAILDEFKHCDGRECR